MGLAPATVERFLGLVAHHHGQLWNAAAPARAIGIAETTARKYLDLFSDALMIRVLQPWMANYCKRLVKTPKVYFRDSGLLHALLGVADDAAMLRNPAVGASWEGMVVEQLLQRVDDTVRPYFWRTSGGAELDVLLPFPDGPVGFDIKRADAPRVTPSIRSALADLDLRKLYVVYPGARRLPLADRVELLPVTEIASVLPR